MIRTIEFILPSIIIFAIARKIRDKKYGVKMKRKAYLIITIILLILTLSITAFFLFNTKTKQNKKEEIKQEEKLRVKDKDDLPKNIDELISYKVSDNYNVIEEICYHEGDKDEKKNIIVERSYEKPNNFGRFTISIFSYKKSEVVVDSDYIINEDDYIKALVKTKKMIIDNHEFIVGFSGMDDFDDVIGRAYVIYDDYVFQFSMSNFDDFLTDEQYNDFISMIKTIKFK